MENGRLSRRLLLNATGAVLATTLVLFAADRARRDLGGGAYGLVSVNSSSLKRLHFQAEVTSSHL